MKSRVPEAYWVVEKPPEQLEIWPIWLEPDWYVINKFVYHAGDLVELKAKPPDLPVIYPSGPHPDVSGYLPGRFSRVGPRRFRILGVDLFYPCDEFVISDTDDYFAAIRSAQAKASKWVAAYVYGQPRGHLVFAARRQP
jgi:hypothetical protein